MGKKIKPRVPVPRKAAPGEAVTIKTLVSHRMESGQRRDGNGDLIPRQIINRFTCRFNEVKVLDVALEPAISSNPYFEFEAIVEESGVFHFSWHDDDGSVYTVDKKISVS